MLDMNTCTSCQAQIYLIYYQHVLRWVNFLYAYVFFLSMLRYKHTVVKHTCISLEMHLIDIKYEHKHLMLQYTKEI